MGLIGMGIWMLATGQCDSKKKSPTEKERMRTFAVSGGSWSQLNRSEWIDFDADGTAELRAPGKKESKLLAKGSWATDGKFITLSMQGLTKRYIAKSGDQVWFLIPDPVDSAKAVDVLYQWQEPQPDYEPQDFP